MKKILFLLIFNFSLCFSNGIPQDDIDELFDESFFIEEVQKEKMETINIIQGKKVENVDPAYTKDNYSRRIIPLVYQTLFMYDSKGNIIPGLAKEYKWINEKELYIKIKDNIYFHDNKLMKACDVKDSLEFLKEKGSLKDLFTDIGDIKALSDDEFIIKFEDEYSSFLGLLASRVAAVVKRENGKIYGTGKYMVESFDNNSLVLKKFIKENDESYPTNVIFSWEIQDNQRCIALFNEQAQVICDIDELALNYGKKYGIITEEDLITEDVDLKTLVFVFGNQKEYTREMRKAIENILPREADTFFPKDMYESNFSKINIKADVKKTADLVEKSKLEKHIKLTILNTDKHNREAVKIKDAMKKFGIDVEILPNNVESYNQKIRDGEYETALFTIPVARNGIFFNIAKIFMSDLENPELYNSLNPFLKSLRIEKKKENRAVIEDKILQLIYKEMPYIPIRHFRDYTVISPELREVYYKWEI